MDKILLSPEQLHIRDHWEYLSLLNLKIPNGVWVINRVLFDFLMNPEVFLQQYPNIEVWKMWPILNPLQKKHLIDSHHPIFEQIIDITTDNEQKESSSPIKTLACWVHLTNQCNLDCSYCYINKDTESMSLDTMKKVISSLKKTIEDEKIDRINLSFAGGEPLMNFSVLQKFVALAKSELWVKLGLTMTTNATLLGPKNIPFLNQEKFSLYISLDGMEKYHDAQRYFKWWEGSFKKVIQWLDNALKNFEGKITVGIVVSPDNVDWLSDVTEYLLKRGVQFKYSFYRPNTNNLMEWFNLDSFQLRLIKELRKCFDIIRNHASALFNPETIFDKLTPKWGWRKQVCSMGDTYFAISHTWGISNCHMTQQEPIFSISVPINIIKTLQHTRSSIAQITADDLACKDCEIVNICKSGCRLVIDEKTKKSMYHKTYMELFDEFIDLIGDLQWKHSQKK